MKKCLKLVGILFFSFWAFSAQAQTHSEKSWQYGLSSQYGLCDISGAERTGYITTKSGYAVGFGAHYWLRPDIILKAEISEQFFSSKQVIYHPYPYVMNLQFRVKTQAIRLSLGCDKTFFSIPELKLNTYAGLGLNADIIHKVEAVKHINYISETQSEPIDIRDSFPDLIPGIYLNAGLLHEGGRLELIFWQDVSNFAIPTVPIGKQTRNFIGVKGTIFLPK